MIIFSKNIIFRSKNKENRAVAWDSLIQVVCSLNLELSLKRNLRKCQHNNKDQVSQHNLRKAISLTMITQFINHSQNNSTRRVVIRINNSKIIFSDSKNKKNNYKQNLMLGITLTIRRIKIIPNLTQTTCFLLMMIIIKKHLPNSIIQLINNLLQHKATVSIYLVIVQLRHKLLHRILNQKLSIVVLMTQCSMNLLVVMGNLLLDMSHLIYHNQRCKALQAVKQMT